MDVVLNDVGKIDLYEADKDIPPNKLRDCDITVMELSDADIAKIIKERFGLKSLTFTELEAALSKSEVNIKGAFDGDVMELAQNVKVS